MTKSKLIDSFLKENYNLLDITIAEKIVEKYPKQFPREKLDSLRKRVGERRRVLGLKREESLDVKIKKGDIKIEDVIREDQTIVNLKKSSADYKTKYKHALEELEKVNKKLNTLIDLKGEKVVIYNINPKIDKNVSQSIPIVLASDWHLGEIVRPETVNGLNEFNLEIARKRVLKFFQSILKLIEIEKHATKIDTLVLALLGDLMNGYIHDDSFEDSDMSPVETVIELRNLIVSGLQFLKKEGGFKEIIVPTSIGNHGRTTPYRRISTSHQNSYEWLLYKLLEADYIDDKVIKFQVGNGYHNWLRLFDKYDIRAHHGDGVTFWGGVGGLTIPVNKSIAQWNKIKTAYLDIFGHFHTYFDGSIFLCNGSLVGYNAYALSIKASYEEPKQIFTLIDRDRGKTVVRPIFCTEK